MLKNLQSGVNNETITLCGTVYFVLFGEGSKSEHLGPVLLTDSDLRFRLYAKKDNPFNHETFRLLAGKEVRLTGTWKHNVVVVLREDIDIVLGIVECNDE